MYGDGSGIAEERLGHLFDHGYAIHDAPEHRSSSELELNSRGLDLGLGIPRGIVEAHGGTVSASNRERGGSLFRVCIPRLDIPDELRAA